jgi:hypothetical protein
LTNQRLFLSEKNDMQQQITSAFLNSFQLTPDELVALHGNKQKRDAPLTNEIFSALDHIQKIHSDCKILMQSGHQTLALDIMEQMTLHQVHTINSFGSKSLRSHHFRRAPWKGYIGGRSTTVETWRILI